MEPSAAPAGEASAVLIERNRQGYAATLDRLLPSGSQVVLLDYPSHQNIGDHLIWLGETAYLGGRTDLSVRFISDRFSYSHGALARHLPPGAIVLLHGGGNFGDLYPQVQKMREAIIEHFPHHPFIQLPQTISFDNPVSIGAIDAVLARHRDFVLLARDQKSLEFAQAELPCKVELCVDAAFMLGRQRRTVETERPIQWIARRDEESAHSLVDSPDDVEVFDWADVDIDMRSWTFAYRRSRLLAAGLAGVRAFGIPLGPLDDKLIHAFDGPSGTHARAGFRQLSRAKVLVTDRLHGHIMALLMDIPHVVLDSSSSKVKDFYDTWTHSARCAHWADTPEVALELARSLLRE